MCLQWQKTGQNLSVSKGFNKSGVADAQPGMQLLTCVDQVQIESKEMFSQREMPGRTSNGA